jgi:hypothetical protein
VIYGIHGAPEKIHGIPYSSIDSLTLLAKRFPLLLISFRTFSRCNISIVLSEATCARLLGKNVELKNTLSMFYQLVCLWDNRSPSLFQMQQDQE